MKVLIAGDYCDKLRVSKKIKEGDFESLFGDIKAVVESADYSIVNFEFPIALKEGKPIPKCGPNLKGQPQSVDAIKYAGFKCCTLANNHTLDQGEQCGLDTKKLIEEAGLDTVGFGCNIEEASRILYIKVRDEVLAIINCCEHEFSIATDKTVGANALNPIQQFYKIQEAKKKANHVLVIVHGGHEHFQLPSPRMKETYRFFIDAGADAVVNHHQHCYSGFEIYNGRPIFYGLGNFLFDHLKERYSIWNTGFMVELDFNDCLSFKIIPYNQCNESPSVTLMRSDSLAAFEQSVNELNRVISDSQLLSEKWIQWINNNSSYFLSIFQPYNNRILRALYCRHLLPSFLTKKRSGTPAL